MWHGQAMAGILAQGLVVQSRGAKRECSLCLDLQLLTLPELSVSADLHQLTDSL